MAQKAAAAEKQASTSEQELFPPEERFWKRYSPHHEFPVSGAASITLHAVALGALCFLALRLVGGNDVDRPVKIDMVEIDGADGNFDGLGLGKSFFKEEKRRRTEFTTDGSGNPSTVGKPDAEKRDDNAFALNNLKRSDLKLDADGKEPEPGDKSDNFSELDRTVKGIEHSIAMAMNPSAKTGGGPKSGKDDVDQKGSSGGPKGTKGKGLRGSGGGAGSSPYGKIFTNQQKRQMRWKILASADGTIHLAKLRALKVTLVVPTQTPGVFNLMDLSKPKPVFERATNLVNQGDKVWWTNRDTQQVGALAAVLRIPAPHAFVIFLPKALEERMLELEQRHQGRSEDEIELTVWDVPFRDGHYAREPEIVQQHLREALNERQVLSSPLAP